VTDAANIYAWPTVEVRSPVPLWLSELLDDPALGAEVVAGHAGVDQRGPIRWAHISELPDPTPWLEGGELLLTTGLGVKDSEELQRRFVGGIAERGVVALGFAMGVTLDAVPDAMLEACEQHALPLFTMPYEIPFIAVSRRVAHHSFEEHYATLRSAIALHRQVLASVTTDGGIPGVLATVARAMPGVALITLDFSGRELARVDEGNLARELDAAMLFEALPHDRPRATVSVDDRTLVGTAVMLGRHLEALVVAVCDRPLLEHEELLFEQGVAGVNLELARHRSVRDAQRSRVDELLEEVASGRTTSAMVARSLARLGAKPLETFRVLAVARPVQDDHALCTLVEDALVDLGPPVVGHLDGVVHAVVADRDDAAERIVAAGVRRGWPDLRVGRSRAKTELDALRAALREAGVALRLEDASPIRDVDSLGLPGLLAGIRDDLGAADFVDQVLGPVLLHDARDEGALIRTLKAYLAHGCRPGPAADELCVHRHTLAYRLDRVRDLTGRDPRSGDHLIEFGLALELLERATP
jgi:PucR family transcriptional regulator, purine catabolism regulatory protein